VDQGFSVRVVKGQWPDPEAPKHDQRTGYLEVVRRLAGRARHVAVASHDLQTARQALDILLTANTSTSLELLYGLPSRRQIELASSFGVPVRIYVPYGSAYLPYCLAQMKRNPRIAWWLLRDALRR
jgi:proline dehydrogenase